MVACFRKQPASLKCSLHLFPCGMVGLGLFQIHCVISCRVNGASRLSSDMSQNGQKGTFAVKEKLRKLAVCIVPVSCKVLLAF